MTSTAAPRSTDPGIRSVAPTFLVSDVAATVAWRRDHLGVHPAGNAPAQPPGVGLRDACIRVDGAA